MIPPPQIVQIHAAHIKGLVADNLRGGEFVDLIKEVPLPVHLCHQIIPCGNVTDRDAEGIADIHDSHEIIILCLIQGLTACDGSGSHHADYLPLHQTLGLLRILHLFSNGHLIPFLHQLVQVSVHSMVGNPAHRRPFFETALLSRQGKLQFP